MMSIVTKKSVTAPRGEPSLVHALTYATYIHANRNNKTTLIAMGRAHATKYCTALPSPTATVSLIRKKALAQQALFALHQLATAA